MTTTTAPVRGLAGLAIAALLSAGLAACGGSSAPSSTSRASAKAEVSALAKDPAVVKAKAKWKPVVTSCSHHQHWVFHPFRSIKDTITCAGKNLTPAERTQAEQCAGKVVIANGIGHGKLHADVDGAALCLAKAAPHGPGS